MQLRSDLKAKQFVIKSFLANPFRRSKLAYVVEAQDWAIYQVGQAITSHVATHHHLPGFITATPRGLTRKILHFGSTHTAQHLSQVSSSNQTVLTIFHVVSGKTNPAKILDIASRVDRVHTASAITQQQLLSWGVPAMSLSVIPLGVDPTIFHPHLASEKQKLRRQLHISPESMVIGSFQKDGVGWQQGFTPKVEKGPDVFVNVLSKLATHYPLHVLLVGPARGFLSRALQQRNIPFTSVGHLTSLAQVARYYTALDLYLITSRVEGGPLAILEAWASGVPVVSTRVGMVPDIAVEGEHALLADPEDTDTLSQQVARMIDNPPLRQQLITSALERVQQFHWDKVATLYYEHLYHPLLHQA